MVVKASKRSGGQVLRSSVSDLKGGKLKYNTAQSKGGENIARHKGEENNLKLGKVTFKRIVYSD